MNSYRYTLEKYKGKNTRYICPNCNQKTFVRYIDTETNRHISPQVGRCNRISNCSYHYTPKEYFQDNNIDTPAPINRNIVIPQQKPVSYIPLETFKESLGSHEPNNFVKYLISLFGVEITTKLVSDYFIVPSNYWPGATIFWQIDTKGKIRTGKIMLYDASMGKRIKKPCNYISWVHAALKMTDFNLKQCFFGEHLLQDRTKPVAIVESEKTAIISSVYFPRLIWLAAGSLEGLNNEKCRVLAGRKVVLFPDLNGFAKWTDKANEFNFNVSDLLEQNATEIERLQGLDLADYLIRFDYREFTEPTPPPPVKPLARIKEIEGFKTKPGSWDIKELETFFESVKLPGEPIELDKCSQIADIHLFIKSHLDIVRYQNGNARYQPYLDRLNELKNILKTGLN